MWKERKNLKRGEGKKGVEEKSRSGDWERKRSRVFSLFTLRTRKKKRGGEERGIRNVEPEVDTVSSFSPPPVSRNCWINNCRTEQKNGKHWNSVIYCASSVYCYYCENTVVEPSSARVKKRKKKKEIYNAIFARRGTRKESRWWVYITRSINRAIK